MVYETAIISMTAGIATIGLILTLAAFYQDIRRKLSFILSISGIIVFALYTTHRHLSQLRHLRKFLDQCRAIYKGRDLPAPDSLLSVHASMGLATLLLGLWLFTKWERSGGHAPNLVRETISGSLMIAISITLVVMDIVFFVSFIKMREAVGQLSHNSTEDERGIGQVIALFAWGPLLKGMCYYQRKDNSDEQEQFRFRSCLTLYELSEAST